jgi:endonuclease G
MRLSAKSSIGALLALFLVLTPLAGQQPDPHIRFGMPAAAKHERGHAQAFLIARPQYTLSYNAETRIPNWVCWRLKQSDIGNAARAAFEPDPELRRERLPAVTTHVYDNSGFDRGHLCNAKDRSSSPEDIKATFYLSNIVPQSPNCNQRGWEKLEDYCRRLAKEGHTLYIAAGPAGVGGTGKNGPAKEIGKGRLQVTVPKQLWKVVLVLPREDAEPRRNTRVIATIFPNDQSVNYDWGRYRVTTRQVEKLSGCRFFSALPKDVAEALRDHLDEVEIPAARPRRGSTREKE